MKIYFQILYTKDMVRVSELEHIKKKTTTKTTQDVRAALPTGVNKTWQTY